MCQAYDPLPPSTQAQEAVGPNRREFGSEFQCDGRARVTWKCGSLDASLYHAQM